MLAPFFKDSCIEAGCDEAGRGCLAGPVVAAAVILQENFNHSLLNDSKQLTESQRILLEPVILEKSISYGIGIVSEREIEEINILNASILAMHRALHFLNLMPEHIIIDGNRFKSFNEIPFTCIVKGDSKYMAIAAASVLAKNYRDRIMLKLHEINPNYSWDKNKGYPTKSHREAIKTFGVTEYHRKTFNLLGEANQLTLFS